MYRETDRSRVLLQTYRSASNKCFISFLSVGFYGRSGLLAPIKNIGAAGSCAGFRRLLANEVLETFVGEVQGCGVAFRSLFGMSTLDASA